MPYLVSFIVHAYANAFQDFQNNKFKCLQWTFYSLFQVSEL